MNQISDQEVARILDLLKAGYNTATHWLQWRTEDISRTRRRLQKLATDGFVEPVTSSQSSRVYWWKITDMGRAWLEQHGAALVST